MKHLLADPLHTSELSDATFIIMVIMNHHAEGLNEWVAVVNQKGMLKNKGNVGETCLGNPRLIPQITPFTT